MSDGSSGGPAPRHSPMTPGGSGPSGPSGPTGSPGPMSSPPPANGTTAAAPAAGERQGAHRADLVQVTQPATDAKRPQNRVRGRIDIADEVIEKVAAAAAYEVEGVAELGGDVDNALEWMRERIGIGRRRGEKVADQSISAEIDGREAEIDVVITIKYGYPLVDVARRVQANVAYQANLMLGLNILAVNVTIEDIEMPANALSYKSDEGRGETGGYSISG